MKLHEIMFVQFWRDHLYKFSNSHFLIISPSINYQHPFIYLYYTECNIIISLSRYHLLCWYCVLFRWRYFSLMKESIRRYKSFLVFGVRIWLILACLFFSFWYAIFVLFGSDLDSWSMMCVISSSFVSTVCIMCLF